jgi:hypothetical protein
VDHRPGGAAGRAALARPLLRGADRRGHGAGGRSTARRARDRDRPPAAASRTGQRAANAAVGAAPARRRGADLHCNAGRAENCRARTGWCDGVRHAGRRGR